MAFTAITPRQTDPSAGVWRYPPRLRQSDPTLREMSQLLAAAVAGALTTGMLATLVLMSGAARAHIPDATEMEPSIIFNPNDLRLPPICTCTLPPFGND